MINIVAKSKYNNYNNINLNLHCRVLYHLTVISYCNQYPLVSITDNSKLM